MIPPREFIRKIPPFSFLSAAELDALVTALEVVLFETDTTVYRQHQMPACTYVIFSGLIGLFDGQTAIDYLGRGEIFGILSAYGAKALHAARALENTVCYAIELRQFQQVFAQNRQFADFFTTFLARQFSSFRALTQDKKIAEEAAFVIEVQRILYKQPVCCRAAATIFEAVAEMQRQAVSSIVAIDAQRRPIGILTHKDLKRVILQGAKTDTVAAHMSAPVRTVPATASIFETFTAMVEIGIDHLVAIRPAGDVLGVVTRKDIQIHLEPTFSIAKLYRKVLKAVGIEELQAIHQSLRFTVAKIVMAGAGFFDLSKMLCTVHDALVGKTIEIAAPQALSPSLAWIHMGSSGRREEIIATDQDNALIRAGAQPAEWAPAVTQALQRIGMPLCPGGYMASNPSWNQSLAVWRERFAHWFAQPDAEHVRYLSVFLDMRAVWGAGDLLAELMDFVRTQATEPCVRLLAADAIELEPPLGIAGIVRLHQGLDLKLYGIYPIVNGARALALQHGLLQVTNTRQRLEALQQCGGLDESLARELIEAYGVLQDLRLRRQAQTVLNQAQADNRVSARDLTKMDLLLLKEALKIVRGFQHLLATRYDVKRVVVYSQL